MLFYPKVGYCNPRPFEDRTGPDLVEIGKVEVAELLAETAQDNGGVHSRVVRRSKSSDERHIHVARATQVLNEGGSDSSTNEREEGRDDDYARDQMKAQ